MEAIQLNKLVFNHLHEVIGLTPKVYSFFDEKNISKIDMYTGVDRPDFGITTYSTIGLSNYPIGLATKNGKELRVEFISLSNSENVDFPNILASCAFHIINDSYSCRPGTVYPDVISTYCADTEMKHIFFTSPYVWDELTNLETEDRLIAWLFAIPISENEFLYQKEHGSNALDELLEEQDVDVLNLHRKSVL